MNHVRRPGSLLAAAAIALAACTGGASASPTSSQVGVNGTPTSPSEAPSPSSGIRSVQPIASIKVPGASSMVVGPTDLWVQGDAGIVRIDPATNKVDATYPTPGDEFAVTSDSLWITDFNADLVERIDLATGKTVASIASPPGPEPIVASNGQIWFGGHHAGTISRIDPKTNKIVASIQVRAPGSGGPSVIVPIGRDLWVGIADDPKVVVIDPVTAKVTRSVSLPAGGTTPFEIDRGKVWVDNDNGIAVLDPSLTKVQGDDIDVGGLPGFGGVTDDGAVWVPVQLHTADPPGVLAAIDPTTNAIVDQVALTDGAPDQVLEAFGSIWVELGLTGSIDRLSPAALTVAH
jgi:virginiamycin B lyase